MKSAAIAAIVVTYRSAETIGACLIALKAADGVSEIRVVDNGSDDGTMDIVQSLAARDQRIRFIANPDNRGFAAACNQGAGASMSPWLAFVNPDLIVGTRSLRALVEASESLQGALMGADLVDDSGERDGAARRKAPDFAAMLRKPASRVLNVPRSEETLQCVEAISGALMLIPRALFIEIGGFDSNYRLHAEDLDLCRRVCDSGHRVAIHNDVVVHHVRGVSSRARPWFVEWHKHRGLWRYFRKFDAAQHNIFTCCAVFVMIHTRFTLVSAHKALHR